MRARRANETSQATGAAVKRGDADQQTPAGAARPAATGPRAGGQPPDGGGKIVWLMVLFTAAIFAVVGAVWALAAVGGWWMLALAMSVHLLASAIVLLEVAHVMTGATKSPTSSPAALLNRLRRSLRRKMVIAR